jgi:hypothetical protein
MTAVRPNRYRCRAMWASECSTPCIASAARDRSRALSALDSSSCTTDCGSGGVLLHETGVANPGREISIESSVPLALQAAGWHAACTPRLEALQPPAARLPTAEWDSGPRDGVILRNKLLHCLLSEISFYPAYFA